MFCGANKREIVNEHLHQCKTQFRSFIVIEEKVNYMLLIVSLQNRLPNYKITKLFSTEGRSCVVVLLQSF